MPTSNNVIQVIINGKNNALPAFRSATRMIAAFGAAAVAALTAATIRAAKFERGMAEIATLLDGDVTPEIKEMRGEIMDLSVEFGQALGKMTKARYDVISAGFTDAADSAMVLREASKLAVAGVSDVATTADLLTDALGGLELGADQAARVSNVLFQTVRKGKTTMAQLGQGLGKVFGTAKVAGVSLELLGAAMATATTGGVKTAEAITGLNALMLALAAPTKEAAAALKEAGIDIEKGFLQSIIDIGSASGDSLPMLRKLIPSVEALRVASKVAGNVALLQQNLDAMANSAGVVDDAFDKMSETFDFNMDQMTSAIDVLAITVGNFLLPALTGIVSEMTDAVVVMAIVAQNTENGKTLWQNYATALTSEVGPALIWIQKRLLDVIDFALFTADNIAAIELNWSKLILTASKSGRVLEKILGVKVDKAALEAAEASVKSAQAVKSSIEIALAEVVKLRAELDKPGSGLAFFEGIFKDATALAEQVLGPLLAELAKARAELANRKKAEGSSGSGAVPGDFIGPRVAVPAKATEEIDELKDQIASLAEYTREDFAEMAFSIGDSFAMVTTEVGAHMLGLTKGPLMLGRAFASMATSIIADISRVIARLLVARALMSVFSGSSFISKVAGGLTKMASGGTIPRAASGMGIPSSMSMVIPGSPGLDRSLVLAHGGEVMVPRGTVEGIDRSRKRAQLAPPPARRNKGRSGTDVINVQAYRPFRREEQNLLTDSVLESEDRSQRWRG